jgi:putative membrane protein
VSARPPSTFATAPEPQRFGFAQWLALFVFSWLSNVLALFVASWIIPDMSYGDEWWTLLVAALVFAAVNTVIRPLVILFGIVAIVLTFGLGLFFINMFMLWLTSLIVPDLEVGGFWSYVGATIIIWLVNVIVGVILKPRSRLRPRDSGVVTGYER